MIILGIESSCDDTAAAVLEDNAIRSNILSSQNDIHTKFGGVVPELASRSHLVAIQPVVAAALSDAGITLREVDLIAATRGPGLIGSLLVGFSYAKALSYVHDIPLVGVDHMAGHILSVFLDENKPAFPFIALIVSGGTSSLFLAEDFNSYTLLGRTRDDAAGEAFDKIAKILDLPYPGGPHVSAAAENGNPQAFSFPRAWLEENSLDFSFSGLKTAVSQQINQYKNASAVDFPTNDICSSFEAAVVDVLVTKTISAAIQNDISTIVIGGGVSANRKLRQIMAQQCEQKNFSFYAPNPRFCTDNAAMIALAGYHSYSASGPLSLDDDVYSRSALG